MVSAPTERRLRKARTGVSVLFVCFGISMATWAVHLPSVQRATGMSTAMVGTILLVSGLGALTGMQVCGPLADRLGGATVGRYAAGAMAVSVLAPLAATSTAWVAAGALLFGTATGAADVAMNTAAVQVERAYRQPIMGSFHALFSMGSVAGSLLATIGFTLHLTTPAASAAVAAVVLVVLLAAAGLLRGAQLGDPAPVAAGEVAAPASTHRLQVVVLGSLAFLLLLSEGAAMDWSSLHAQQHFGSTPALGSIAFGCFVAAMTAGRFCADAVAGRFGAVATIRWGCAVAALGVTTVLLAPDMRLALAGWVLFGAGLAGGIPQVFTAAGNIGPGAGAALARVVGMGYVALLAGPALIGWLAELSSINTALALPLGAVVVCALAATAVRARERHP
ncbi:MFS transporter [Mycolicibacterium cosmeticum]|uniref:Major facilitator superfamily protein n=1 Tax=Mycolicibacterium cosmeticum TaxID=258533 RepID=W9BMB9_MYCCO|nr:MFS transporter [Mycolicibacterium cosmeticum]TLH74174.1 MFS transporter [Mycolicibacterium cosmeticum]CDO11130.1 putative major facilitator superfamily protein [Mycolicibacterium cosmeticum]